VNRWASSFPRIEGRRFQFFLGPPAFPERRDHDSCNKKRRSYNGWYVKIPFRFANVSRVHSIRYPDPLVKVNDTVKINLETGKIEDFIKFDTGAIAMVTGGRNMGRVGVITHRERHDGGFAIVHLKDAIDNTFATRETNVFVIGSEKPWISLPKGKGVKLTIAEERDRKRAQAFAH